MKNMFKDALILFVITLIAGLGLGLVYNITLDARQEQEKKVKVEAYKSVFSDAENFTVYKMSGKESKSIADFITAKNADVLSTNGSKDINAEVNEIVEAKSADGKRIGYVITVTDNEAYDGSIKFSVGIRNDKTINGISYLSISETPGLGMKAKDDEFMKQFSGKKVEYFMYSKTSKKNNNEIDVLSGATVTTNAVTNGVNAAIFCFEYLTGGGK